MPVTDWKWCVRLFFIINQVSGFEFTKPFPGNIEINLSTFHSVFFQWEFKNSKNNDK